jgi:hypothetical protein
MNGRNLGYEVVWILSDFFFFGCWLPNSVVYIELKIGATTEP